MLHLEGLQPFWDEYLVDTMHSDAILSSNRPERVGTCLRFDSPWEGKGSIAYNNILHDDGIYRMYYLTLFPEHLPKNDNFQSYICYAESTDGINWTKPNLGICAHQGDFNTNILFDRSTNDWDNFFVMKDENPACPPEQKYKAVASWSTKNVHGEGGYLMCLISADGIHFTPYKPIETTKDCDSLNIIYWDRHRKKYICYFRGRHKKPESECKRFNEGICRNIRITESDDFEHWSEPVRIDFSGAEDYPLYTSCISPYIFDDRYYIGFPTRYVERHDWTKNYDRLCGKEQRRKLMEVHPRIGLTVTDCVFMSSRDGLRWTRFDEACMLPGPEHDYNWVYGDCYPAIGCIETKSRFGGKDTEISVYAPDNHFSDIPEVFVRYVYRKDGFASYKADYNGKKLRTKPFTFNGKELEMNFRTSARGGIVVKFLDEHAVPLEGYTSCEIFGDSTARVIDFDKDLSALNEKTVRLEFEMCDAELYSIAFK
ncbi:MAG: hypothetical protein IJN96_00215 [Clostridia bacterium]|nr:hypothetical protein [Clostridia bacterium]